MPSLLHRLRSELSATYLLSVFFSCIALGFGALMLLHFLQASLPLWSQMGLDYFLGTRWAYRAGQFGIAPMIYGTLLSSCIAIVWAAVCGVCAAIFIHYYLSAALRQWVKPLIELLAGVPSVIYGLLGILFLREWVFVLLEPLEPLSGDTLLTAGILLGVMILPTVVSLVDEALAQVPTEQLAAARSLGFSKAATILKVGVPLAFSGIISAVLLAFGRALGETVAVFLVVGRMDNQWAPLSLRSWIEPGQTLTSKLGSSETHIAYGEPLHWAALMGLGLTLLIIVVSVTLAGRYFSNARIKL